MEIKISKFSINEKISAFFTVNLKLVAEPRDFNVFIGGSFAATLEASFQYN
jgi:hypothetical protein